MCQKRVCFSTRLVYERVSFSAFQVQALGFYNLEYELQLLYNLCWNNLGKYIFLPIWVFCQFWCINIQPAKTSPYTLRFTTAVSHIGIYGSLRSGSYLRAIRLESHMTLTKGCNKSIYGMSNHTVMCQLIHRKKCYITKNYKHLSLNLYN